MTTLRSALQALLAGWRSDLSPEWSSFLDGVEPDFAGVSDSLLLAPGEVLYPGRADRPPAGARADACLFRALAKVAPSQVRVVVIGQDPYTKVSQATGRSFEQGDLADWLGRPAVTPSLRRILQSLAAWRTGDARYATGKGWSTLVEDLRAKRLAIESARQLWDHWQSHGALFLNAILTFSRFEPAVQFKGHGVLWRPVMHRLLQKLANRPGRPAVFVAWGGTAKEILNEAGVEAAAKAAGTWKTSVDIVSGPHPNARPADAPPFLVQGNAFKAINDALVRLNGQPIKW